MQFQKIQQSVLSENKRINLVMHEWLKIFKGGTLLEIELLCDPGCKGLFGFSIYKASPTSEAELQ